MSKGGVVNYHYSPFTLRAKTFRVKLQMLEWKRIALQYKDSQHSLAQPLCRRIGQLQ
jgi:hypothetical protein